MEEMRSHRESISLIKGETGTGTPVAKADTSVRIQRQRKFMPVPCRRRQAYDVPSTVSRGAYSPISLSLSVSLSALPSLARSSADHSSPSLSADGEPLSKSYATQHRSSARALIIFPRAAVPEFLNGGWMKPVLRPPLSVLLPSCKRPSPFWQSWIPALHVYRDPSFYFSHSLSRSLLLFFSVYVKYIYPVPILAAETFAIFLPPIPRLRRTLPGTPQ